MFDAIRINFSHIMLLSLVLFLFSCKAEDIFIPKGFEVINSKGPYHFVYMDKKFAGNEVIQRKAGNIICTKMNTIKYCEVYFWLNKKDVQTSMPMHRTSARRGVFYLNDGNMKLKLLN